MTIDALFTFVAEPVGPGRTRAGNNARIGGAIAAAIAVGTGLVRALTGGTATVRVMPYAAVGIVAAATALAVTIKRARLGSGSTGTARLALSAAGVTLTSAVQTTTIQWAAVRVEESRSDFVFYLPDGPVRVRKAAITEAQGVERLRSFLLGQAGTRAKLLT